MNALERLADDIGQVTFRLETYFDLLLNHCTITDQTGALAADRMHSGLEQLKALKERAEMLPR